MTYSASFKLLKMATIHHPHCSEHFAFFLQEVPNNHKNVYHTVNHPGTICKHPDIVKNNIFSAGRACDIMFTRVLTTALRTPAALKTVED
jgi:hypothetical protein